MENIWTADLLFLNFWHANCRLQFRNQPQHIIYFSYQASIFKEVTFSHSTNAELEWEVCWIWLCEERFFNSNSKYSTDYSRILFQSLSQANCDWYYHTYRYNINLECASIVCEINNNEIEIGKLKWVTWISSWFFFPSFLLSKTPCKNWAI